MQGLNGILLLDSLKARLNKMVRVTAQRNFLTDSYRKQTCFVSRYGFETGNLLYQGRKITDWRSDYDNALIPTL